MEMSNLLLSSTLGDAHATQLQRAHLPAFLNLSQSHLKSTLVDHSMEAHLPSMERPATLSEEQITDSFTANLIPSWMTLNQPPNCTSTSLSAILHGLSPSPLSTNQMTPLNISPATLLQGSLLKSQHNITTPTSTFGSGGLPTSGCNTVSDLTASSAPPASLPLPMQPFPLIPPSPYSLSNMTSPLPNSHSMAMAAAALQQQQLQNYLAANGNPGAMIPQPSSLPLWPSMMIGRELENRFDEASLLSISRLGLPLSFYNLLAMAEPNSEQRSIPNPQEVLENWRQFQQAALANNLDPYYLAYSHGLSMEGPHGLRRKNATRETTHSLKAWLLDHGKNPYPTKGEKIMLAVITRMTLTQVSTWFANARRRLKKETRFSSQHQHQHSGGMSGESHNSSSSCRRASSLEIDLGKSSPPPRHPLSMSPHSAHSSLSTDEEDDPNHCSSRTSSRTDLERVVDESPGLHMRHYLDNVLRPATHDKVKTTSSTDPTTKVVDHNHHQYSAYSQVPTSPNSLLKTLAERWEKEKASLSSSVSNSYPVLSPPPLSVDISQLSNPQLSHQTTNSCTNSDKPITEVKRQKIWSIVDSLDEERNCSQPPSPSPPLLLKESAEISSNTFSSRELREVYNLSGASEMSSKWQTTSDDFSSPR